MAVWGKTGRVTFISDAIYVDGKFAGTAFASAQRAGEWFAARRVLQLSAFLRANAVSSNYSYHPTLDAAVLWVLKRADVNLWREERGPVPVVFASRVKHPASKARWGRVETNYDSWPVNTVSFHKSWEEAIAKAVAA